ncbi:MAG: hypothetical protein QXR89_05730 [Candidatus Bathyarchaeia archaeon]
MSENEKLSLFTFYYVGIAVSAVVGSKFFPQKRVKYLKLWPFIGGIATLLMSAFFVNNLAVNILLAFFLGISIGVGFPSCMGNFADSTFIEERGFIGGVVWSAVGFFVLLFAILISMFGRLEMIIMLALWRFLGGAGFLFMQQKCETFHTRKSLSYAEILHKKDTLLYLFPWILFCIINWAEIPIIEKAFTAVGIDFSFVLLVEFALIGVFALLGGIIADAIGRKRVVIAGFIMLGIEYAAMSISFNSPITLYLFLTFDGSTWGLFFSVFFMTLWGDLGENYEKEKYYILGGLPYLLAGFVSVLIEPYVRVISSAAAFSFASFFLFLAVVPLMFAPETLPEKALKERELRSYIEKAKRVREKFTKS